MGSTNDDVVHELLPLLALRTDNPGGDEPTLARFLADRLRTFAPDELRLLELTDPQGVRRASVFARWGEPSLLLNAHLDTVPANQGWTRDPWQGEVAPGPDGEPKVFGLGAADTKGAIAAILAALARERPEGGVGVLFSGDEELGSSCIRDFLRSELARPIRRAIVCEPTRLQVGVRHRGIVSIEAAVRGAGGHSSLADQLPKPMVAMAHVALALDALGQRHRELGPAGFKGLCVNIAGVEGGLAFNVVPDTARLIASLRPPPGSHLPELMEEIDRAVRGALADQQVRAHVSPDDTSPSWRATRSNAPFGCPHVRDFAPLLGQSRVDAAIDLAFWTEAAEMVAAGINAVVFGPGAIEQAHGPDEFVSLNELTTARDIFAQLFRAHRATERVGHGSE